MTAFRWSVFVAAFLSGVLLGHAVSTLALAGLASFYGLCCYVSGRLFEHAAVLKVIDAAAREEMQKLSSALDGVEASLGRADVEEMRRRDRAPR